MKDLDEEWGDFVDEVHRRAALANKADRAIDLAVRVLLERVCELEARVEELQRLTSAASTVNLRGDE